MRSVKRRDDGDVLQPPPRGEPARIPVAGAVARISSGRSRRASPKRAGAQRAARRRLAAPARAAPGRRVPSPEPRAPAARADRCASRASRRDRIRPEFDWAGAIAQAVGQVVHVELQRMADARVARAVPTSGPRRAGAAGCAALGIDEAHLAGGARPHPARHDGRCRQRARGAAARPGGARGGAPSWR